LKALPKVKTKDQLKILDNEIFQKITRLKIERSLLETTMKYIFPKLEDISTQRKSPS
jgi:hypothetical protein